MPREQLQFSFSCISKSEPLGCAGEISTRKAARAASSRSARRADQIADTCVSSLRAMARAMRSVPQ